MVSATFNEFHERLQGFGPTLAAEVVTPVVTRAITPNAAPQSPPERRPGTGRFGSVVGWLAVIVTLAMLAILDRVALRLTPPFGGERRPRDVTLPKAAAGEYQVRVKYFAQDANRASTRMKVYATTYERFSTPQEKVVRSTVMLAIGKEMREISAVVVGNGAQPRSDRRLILLSAA